MNRFVRLAAVFLGLVGLTACTGTTELPSPVLLVTGYQDATGAKVALVRDNLRVSASRLAFLPASVRTLPAPAVSYDVVDRERARSSLVVLSRTPTTTASSATGYLTSFSLNGIDPLDPAAFVQQGAAQTINDFTVVPRALIGQVLVFCPSRLQVTQGGDYAAVLNQPELCGLQEPAFIDILDLRSTRLLARLTGVGGVSSSGLYLSQNPAQDLLYYATLEAGGLRLQRATLPRPGQVFGLDDTVISVPVVAVPRPAGQNDAVDLQRAGADTEERLVVLFRNSLVDVTRFGATGQVGQLVATPPNNAQVIRDDRRSTESTFILSTPRTGIFTYLPPPSESGTLDQQSARVVATDAVIVPIRNLIYFVGVSPQIGPVVSLFDLSAYSVGNLLPNPTPLSVPQLTAPSFVTWAQSVPRSP